MKKKMMSFAELKRYGINLGSANRWVDTRNPLSLAQAANDAAMLTSPNTTVPAELLAFFDPEVIEILTAPRNATEIFPEVKKGSWTTPYVKFRVSEMTGSVAPYSDFSNAGKSGRNYNFPTREQFQFQTVIEYGDYEVEVSSEAKISLVADKQRSAADIIAIAGNKFYLLGVEGKNIYGYLNDPDLPSAITPININGRIAWEDKNTKEVYEDILKMFSQLVAQSNANITRDTPLKLTVPPAQSVMLGKATDYNISVIDMLKKYFKDIEVVVLPELSTFGSGDSATLSAVSVRQQKTGEMAYGEKFRAGRVVPSLSSYSQKVTGSTYGFINRIPVGTATMNGI